MLIELKLELEKSKRLRPRKTYHRNADTKNKSSSTADVIQMERNYRKSWMFIYTLDKKVHTYTLTYRAMQRD